MSIQPAQVTASPTQIRSALKIYRVLAFIAGVALVVLLAAMFVRYIYPKDPGFSTVWSPIHGFIYMGYAATIVNLAIKTRWSLKRIVLNLLSGFVPGLPWVAEKRNTIATEAILNQLDPAERPDSTHDRTSDLD